MMIEEFLKLQDPKAEPIKPAEYKLVEFVYTYHPLNFSKEAVASLYNEFGMLMFLDLLPRAKKAAKIEIEVKIAKQHYWDKSEEYNRLGDWKDEEYDLEI